MPFEPPAPLFGQRQGIHQRAEQRHIADAQGKFFQAGDAKRFDRQGQDFAFTGGAIFQPQQFHTRLEELRRPVWLARLMTEDQAVIGNARRETAFRQNRFAADGNGEVGTQRQFAAGRIHQGESAAADFLTGPVQENLRRLQHRGFFPHIATRGEQIEQRLCLAVQRRDGRRVVVGKSRHYTMPLLLAFSIALISATSASRLMLFCASRLATQSARLATSLASSAPSARSLSVTSPRARSSGPSTTAMAAPRLSAYLNWSPILPLPI